MKIVFILFVLFLIGCTQSIQKTNDPIEKSVIILEAISHEKYKLIREEFVGRKETTEKHKDELDSVSMQIFEALKKYGFPKKNKIKIVEREKLQLPKDYGDEFNGKDTIDVVSIKIELNSSKKIEMGFIVKNNEARLLRVGIYDSSVHLH